MVRLPLSHSKLWEMHWAQMAITFAYYNLARPHSALQTDDGVKRSPMMAQGLTDHIWSFREMLEAAAQSDSTLRSA